LGRFFFGDSKGLFAGRAVGELICDLDGTPGGCISDEVPDVTAASTGKETQLSITGPVASARP
jgi:hypothetical protein